MNGLFYATNLSISDIEGLETNNVKDMSFIFSKTQEEVFNFSKFTTNKKTNMSYMFILNLDTNNVQDMTHMLENNKDLPVLYLNNFKTSNAINMNSMFTS